MVNLEVHLQALAHNLESVNTDVQGDPSSGHRLHKETISAAVFWSATELNSANEDHFFHGCMEAF